jgi:hypothetical protein
MRGDDLLATIEQRFDELDLTFQVKQFIDGTPRGGVAMANLGRRSMGDTYYMAFEPAMTFSKATRFTSRAHGLPLLVASDYISEKSAASLRDTGIQYIDGSGNAYIRFQDVLVDVRGRRRRKTDADFQSAQRPSNLFSPRRAQVVLVLLAWPEFADANVRDIAKASGVSVGLVHDTLAMLDESGYLPHGSGSLYRRRELLEYWTAAYPTGLSPRLALASFRGEPQDIRKVNAEDPVFTSGESAATDLIRPETVTIYVESLDPKLPIVNRWRSDLEPNIFVRRKFWSSPYKDDGPLVGLRPAPWPLVYADLVASGDPRQREVAREWRDRHVGPDEM